MTVGTAAIAAQDGDKMTGIPSLVQTTDRNINQLQQNILQALRPIIQNPIANGSVLVGQSLVVGNNTINHGLGRALQGWIVVGISGASTIYDNQATNKNTNLTLILNSSAAVVVNIYVF